MLARMLLPVCAALVASTATTAWAQQPKPDGRTSKVNQPVANDSEPPLAFLHFGVVWGYGQLPGPAVGWMFSGGYRTPSFSIGLEGRTLYDVIVDNPRAPNLFLYAQTVAFPMCGHGRFLYGCLVAQVESLVARVSPFGNTLPHDKWSNKLGIAIRVGYDSPPLRRIIGIPTHLRPFVELGIYSSPRRIEINDNLLWESGAFHFATGCTYGF